MLKSNLIISLILFFLLNGNSQSTKILSNTSWNSQVGTYVTVKKRVLNSPPYQQHGKTETWLEGTLLEVETFYKGKLHGKSKLYYPFGTCLGELWSETNYKQGEIQIEKKYACENGNIYLSEKIEFKNNEENIKTSYYKNGNKETQLINQDTTKMCLLFYENGKMKEKHYHNHPHYRVNNNYTGLFFDYYNNGKLSYTGGFDKDGKLNGEYIVYSEEGAITEKRYYINGLSEKERIEKERIIEENRILNEKRKKEYSRYLKNLENWIQQIEMIVKGSKEVEKLYGTVVFSESNSIAADKDYDSLHGYIYFDLNLNKFKKNKIYLKYLIAQQSLLSELINCPDWGEINQDNILDFKLDSYFIKSEELIDSIEHLINKMKSLRYQKTKNLEKLLETLDDPILIIESLLKS